MGSYPDLLGGGRDCGRSPLEIVCLHGGPGQLCPAVFTAGNVCVERVFGMVRSKTLISLFYFLVLLLMAIPGIAACVVCSILFPVCGRPPGCWVWQ